MRVVGTAGHVDHGKSTLVQALTGINPDRLREEQERQMTIDLGFAWLDLPGGQTIGIVDVPGHIDFIENMLAGVGGIDAAILVVAADEGVMPQTREHVDILELLGIDKGVVALTKTDMVQDADWLDLVEDEVLSLLRNTALDDSPIMRLSAKTGEGLVEFLEALNIVVENSPQRLDLGRPRLSIDRSFTIAGFGTVVTGTLLDGAFAVGDEVEIIPSGLTGRIRGLQTHRASLERAQPGSRVAVNISGVDVGSLRRGDAIVHPGTVRATALVDVHVRQLASAPVRLKHNEQVKLFLGAAQRMGTVRILGDSRTIPAGEDGWLQIGLDEPVAAVKGDRYILRRPSPPATLGGGQIVDPHPGRRHRLKDHDVVNALEKALQGSPAEQMLAAIVRSRVSTVKDASVAAGLDVSDGLVAASELAGEGQVRALGGATIDGQTRVVASASWDRWSRQLMDMVKSFHAAQPMRRGVPQEEARNRLGLSPDVFGALVEELVERGELEHAPPALWASGFKVELDPEQQRRADRLLEAFHTSESAPSMKDAVELAGEPIVRHLIHEGALVALSADVLLERSVYDAWLAESLEMMGSGETLTVGQVRDRFGSSRKYVLAFLEHLDSEGYTLRDGDVRRINPARQR